MQYLFLMMILSEGFNMTIFEKSQLEYFQRGLTFLVIEKANGDRERHRCPSELALKVKIPSEMEVAPRYIQLTLLTLHTLVSPLTLLVRFIFSPALELKGYHASVAILLKKRTSEQKTGVDE